MRSSWIGCLGLLVGLMGCATTGVDPKSATPPHEFKIPPESEARWSQPIQYPEKTLNTPIRRPPAMLATSTGTRAGGGPGQMGSGNGVGSSALGSSRY